MMTQEELASDLRVVMSVECGVLPRMAAFQRIYDTYAEQRQQLKHSSGVIKIQQERIKALADAEPHKTNEFLASQIRKWEQICQEQRAEIERLQDALEKVLIHKDHIERELRGYGSPEEEALKQSR